MTAMIRNATPQMVSPGMTDSNRASPKSRDATDQTSELRRGV